MARLRRLSRALVLTGLVAVLTLPATVARAGVPDPTLSVPPAGIQGHPMWDSYFDLAPFGYEEHEFFVSGTATAGSRSAPYTTRIIVTRPTSAARFNGSVLLDWVNVTAQFENAVDTMEARQMLLREGFAFVHVSAQAAGLCCTPLTPKIWDPVRYAAINHPGDDFAASMFSQIAKAVRTASRGVAAMGNLHVDRVLAAGQSQSADELYKYVSNTAAGARLIDGFLIHGGGRKTFAAPLTAKVLNLLSDEEADPSSPNPAEPNYRVWEIAGTAHSDFFIGYQSVFGLGPRLVGSPQLSPAQYTDLLRTAGNYGEQLHPLLATCVLAGAAMPMHYATSTAIHDLDQWVRTGSAPPNGPRFVFAGGGRATDDLGNTRGGVRLPPIDVPVARYESTTCVLGGLTIPLTDGQLHARYPTHAEYYARMQRATDAAVTGGWLLPPDAVDLMGRVCAAANRWGVARPVCPTYRPPTLAAATPATVLAVTGRAVSLAMVGVLMLTSLAIRRSRNLVA